MLESDCTSLCKNTPKNAQVRANTKAKISAKSKMGDDIMSVVFTMMEYYPKIGEAIEELEIQIEELKVLRDSDEVSIGAVIISDMPMLEYRKNNDLTSFKACEVLESFNEQIGMKKKRIKTLLKMKQRIEEELEKISKKISKKLFGNSSKNISGREIEIIKQRNINGATWESIGKKLNLSPRHCRRIHSKIKK